MKRFRTIAFVMVMAVFAALMGACGSRNISGSYTGTIDYTDVMNDELASSGVKIPDSIEATVDLDLKSDNTYELKLDAQSLIDSVKSAFEKNIDTIVEEAMTSQGITSDQYETVAQAAGYDSFDAMKQDLLDQIESSFESADLGVDEDDLSDSGKYSVSGSNVIFKSDDEDSGLQKATLGSDGSISVSIDTEIENKDYSFDITFTKNS